MKLGVMFANTAASTPETIEELVAVCEDVGVESVWAVEHVFVPKQLRSDYPYTDDGQLAVLSTQVLCDPVVWLSYVAGMSRTLGLATGIMILPQRHPAHVAKEWATLDVLSGGRAMPGVGIGWLVISGPQSPFANIPVIIEHTVQWIGRALTLIRDDARAAFEPTLEAVDGWCRETERIVRTTILGRGEDEHSWFLGANVPGKPHAPLCFFGGADLYFDRLNEVVNRGFEGFSLGSAGTSDRSADRTSVRRT